MQPLDRSQPRFTPSTLGGLLDPARAIRVSAEHLDCSSIVSEATSRSRGRSDRRPVHDALVTLRKSLDEVESIERAALFHLESSLSESDLANLAKSLETATVEARAQIALVAQPEPAPTDAYVLRKRPDLDRAYATNLNAVQRR